MSKLARRGRNTLALATAALMVAACGDDAAGPVDLVAGADLVAVAAADLAVGAGPDLAVVAGADLAVDAAVAPDLTTTTDTARPTIYCGHPADCPTGQTCAPDGTCAMGSCATTGCIYGYDCTAGACTARKVGACDRDSDCTSGARCIAGTVGGGGCVAPSGQCFDAAQCDAHDACAAGRCVPTCTTDSDCRDGAGCNVALGVCTKPLRTCTITNDCGSPAAVCVGGTCVPRSVGATCPTPGDVWDENGCVPNQAPTFTCTTDGAQDTCAPGSICLRRTCWISCDAPHQTACAGQAVLDQCKPLTSSSGAHMACAGTRNLGGQCDPTAAACSAGATCIDGYCK